MSDKKTSCCSSDAAQAQTQANDKTSCCSKKYSKERGKESVKEESSCQSKSSPAKQSCCSQNAAKATASLLLALARSPKLSSCLYTSPSARCSDSAESDSSTHTTVSSTRKRYPKLRRPPTNSSVSFLTSDPAPSHRGYKIINVQ